MTRPNPLNAFNLSLAMAINVALFKAAVGVCWLAMELIERVR